MNVTDIEFSDIPDWRRGPDPKPCSHCGRALTACEGRRMLDRTRCCQKCSSGAHGVHEGGAAV